MKTPWKMSKVKSFPLRGANKEGFDSPLRAYNSDRFLDTRWIPWQKESSSFTGLPLGNVYAVYCSPTKDLIVVTVTTDRPPLSRRIQHRHEAGRETWLLRAIISSRCNARDYAVWPRIYPVACKQWLCHKRDDGRGDALVLRILCCYLLTLSSSIFKSGESDFMTARILRVTNRKLVATTQSRSELYVYNRIYTMYRIYTQRCENN